MNNELTLKYNKLIALLKGMGSVAVAFSGGTDSTCLLMVARKIPEINSIALTVKSPYIPDWEVEEAKELTARYNIKHQIIQASIPAEIINNPPDRCYLCKKGVFTKLWDETKKQGIKYLIDGTNHDDLGDYRPGLKALEELKVHSPLKESGFTKDDIRALSKELGFPTWNKPAYACLLTRIPHNTKINTDILKRIELAEKFIIDLGFPKVRVRDHGDIARIETDVSNFGNFIKPDTLHKITNKLKEIGYTHVTLDLTGYKMGSLNKMMD